MLLVPACDFGLCIFDANVHFHTTGLVFPFERDSNYGDNDVEFGMKCVLVHPCL